MNHKPKGQMGIQKSKAALAILKAKGEFMSSKQIAEIINPNFNNSDITTIGTICNVLTGAGLLIRDETFKGKSMRVVYKAKEQNESI